MTIKPEFFTDTMTWEADGMVAKSLKELKSMFPNRTKIEGYNPNGNTVIKRESERYHVPTRTPLHGMRAQSPLATTTSRQPTPLHGMRAQSPLATTTSRQPTPRYVEYKITEKAWHAEAIKLKETNLKGSAIATRLGISRSAVVGFLWRHNNKIKKERLTRLRETAALQLGTEVGTES